MKIPRLLTAVSFLALPLFPLLYAAEPASIAKASPSISSAVPIPVGEFKDGDTVCFVGDSITKGGDYQTLIELFYAAKFPERRIRYYNCGVGGDSAAAIMSAETFRVNVDILGHKPTVATVMLGMNDVNREGTPAQREVALKVYEERLSKLVRALQAGGARVILLTPSIYDEAATLPRPTLVGVNAALGRCADTVRRLYGQLGTGFVDVYTLMNTINDRERSKNPAFSITGAGKTWNDRIHPGHVGHEVIAHAFLQAQGLVSGEPDLSRPAVAGLAEQRRKLGEDMRELATQRYGMAKQGLNPMDATAFAKWLAEKRALVESKGQKATWIELVQKLLPNEAAMVTDYDALSVRIRQSAQATTH